MTKTCKKCGSEKVTMTYSATTDELDCACGCCQYLWSDKPLDAEKSFFVPKSVTDSIDQDTMQQAMEDTAKGFTLFGVSDAEAKLMAIREILDSI